MILDIDRFTERLDEMACTLPEAFYRELNCGVNILEDTVTHEDSIPGDDLYILGEYLSGGQMGRAIYIYYGSFCAMLAEEPEKVWLEEMDATLRHEFRHHLEGLAGERGLELEDAEDLMAYLEQEREVF